MKADRARASASSVLDALGSDFWSWWRFTIGFSLLTMLIALGLSALLSLTGSVWLGDIVVMVVAVCFCAATATVGYLGALRFHRWDRVGLERRLPAANAGWRWDAVGLLVAGTVACAALAIWALAGALHTHGGELPAAAKWTVAVLAITAGASAIAKAGRSLLTRSLVGLLAIAYYLYLNQLMIALQSLNALEVLGLALAGGGLLIWSFARAAGTPRQPAKQGAWGAARLHQLPTALSSWLDSFGDNLLGTAPVVIMSSALIAAPFIEGRKWPLGSWLFHSSLVILIVAMWWSTPERHWRWRLSPRFARQRHLLALRMWRTQCLRLLPLIAVTPFFASSLQLVRPTGTDASEALVHTALVLPWIVAQGALLLAAATLWVGLRRHRFGWDAAVFATLVVLGTQSLSFVGSPDPIRLNWSGNWGVLAALVLSTAATLALASWAWSRGSLTGMEKWNLARFTPKR